METTLCPHCHGENSTEFVYCQFCGKPIHLEEAATPEQESSLEISPQVSSSQDVQNAQESQDSPPDTSVYAPLPETVADVIAENQTEKLAAQFAGNLAYSSPKSAVGAFADAFLASKFTDKKMLLQETAQRRIIATVVFSLAAFITFSLMMAYHRNIYIFVLVFAALVGAYFLLRGSNKTQYGKRIASMPQTDMESIVTSTFDSLVDKKTNDAILVGIMAVFFAGFIALFWSPHMIFGQKEGEYGLRYYTWAICPEKNVILPDTRDGKPVRAIRANAFEGVTSIETVTLPNQLYAVRAHAFCGCRNLRQVVFPDTIRTIGSSAFRDCPSLKQVTLPKECNVNSRAFKDSGTEIKRE